MFSAPFFELKTMVVSVFFFSYNSFFSLYEKSFSFMFSTPFFRVVILIKGDTYEKFFSVDFARDRKFGPNKQFYERKFTCEGFLGTSDFLIFFTKGTTLLQQHVVFNASKWF